ncbi:arf-GAP domain and FG repeat-containing protein 2 isoform X3 [Cyanistes caeruleus]|uniref:arf-GAP domain and FG repeat-containing protein 2 isoform X3 n=1 Tax=Cyanistes caeruleus TaxID=156563 RepID=UPI000CDB0EB9|nr:arf-GAP domain and FG repeat-containing protein 2 isoform X3 [Cyanistes caeruleus]
MTTFTEAEVLFLQAHGNEACRRVWLGTFNPRTSLLPDSRDPQKVKEFLQEKYEKKRWYVAPEQAKPPQSTTAEPRPPQLLHTDTGTLPQPHPATHHPPQPSRKASTDLLADIGGDPFAGPAPGPAFAAFPGGVAAQGVATPVLPTVGGTSVSLFRTLRDPPVLPHGGYTNPFTAPVAPRASTNPFQSNGPGATFTSPPVAGRFPSPFQTDELPSGGFTVAKASTNPFVTAPAPAAPFGIRHPTTNPFL